MPPTISGQQDTVSAQDFLLPPEAFVGRCMDIHDAEGRLFTRAERSALAEAVRAGRPRLEVLDAILSRADPETRERIRPRLNDLAKGWDGFAVTDLLERYAQDDNEAFVQQAYAQLMNRQPTPVEALEVRFDLNAGRMTRQEFLEALAARSPTARLSTELAGSGLTADGTPRFVLVRPVQDDGWLVAPEIWIQPAPTKSGALQLQEGWVLAGPKRSFPSGRWRLDIDIVQDDAGELAVDVVANSGLDTLLAVNLVGSARLGARFTIESWHRFVEVRFRRPAQPKERNWLRIRDLSMSVCQ